MIAKDVLSLIEKQPYDTILSYDLFDAIPNRNAVYVAVNRLVKNGVIDKYSKGRFYRLRDIESNFNGQRYKFKEGLSNEVVWRDILINRVRLD